MLEIFKTVDNKPVLTDNIEDGVWINLIKPSEQEINKISQALNVELDFLKAALDEEEAARIENEDGNTLIIVDVPIIEKDNIMYVYTTIPLGIVLTNKIIITICLRDDTFLNDFTDNKVKTFFTQYRTRFVLQILYKNATTYLKYLKHISKLSSVVEKELHKATKNKELIKMLKLQKSLVYFSTALKENSIILEKLMKSEHMKKYPEDTDLLEDVIIENKQALEMSEIYSGILTGTMDAFASLISNNVGDIMKYLTAITILMAIPTMVSGFFGMNVGVPLNVPGGFWIIFAMVVGMCGITAYVLYKKNMF